MTQTFLITIDNKPECHTRQRPENIGDYLRHFLHEIAYVCVQEIEGDPIVRLRSELAYTLDLLEGCGIALMSAERLLEETA